MRHLSQALCGSPGFGVRAALRVCRPHMQHKISISYYYYSTRLTWLTWLNAVPQGFLLSQVKPLSQVVTWLRVAAVWFCC